MLLPAVAMIRETSENSPTYLVHDSLVALLYSRTLQSVKIESAKIKSANFFIAFLNDLGNLKHLSHTCFLTLLIFTLCKVR